MLLDLSPNSIVAEFDGPSGLSELKPDKRRAEITLYIVDLYRELQSEYCSAACKGYLFPTTSISN